MCEADSGWDNGFESEMDSDADEGLDIDSGSEVDSGSAFEELDDIERAGEDSETAELLGVDFGEENYEGLGRADETGEYSSLDEVAPELMISSEYLEELELENADNPDFANQINELVASGRLAVEDTVEEVEGTLEGGQEIKVLTREFVPELREIQEEGTEADFRNEAVFEEEFDEEDMLDITEVGESENELLEQVELVDLSDIDEIFEMGEKGINTDEFLTAENSDILDSLEEVDSLSEHQAETNLENEELESVPEIEQIEELAVENELETDEEEIEETENEEIQELNINYDEIYEGLSQESLQEGFQDINIYTDTERLDSSLENFEESSWEGLSLESQKESMADLAEYVEEIIGFDSPPKIEYYNNPREGDYGGYSAATNTLRVNEYMLYNSREAADTIAHELWHAHQHECAENPQSQRDYQYQYNFENYITPELGHEAYQNQLLEAEARAFAAQFKGRLDDLSRRVR